jgi:hypothetical protein
MESHMAKKETELTPTQIAALEKQRQGIDDGLRA